MNAPVRMLKELPSEWIMNKIASPPNPSVYLPFQMRDGKTRPPRIGLSTQASIRQLCLFINVDPLSVGLPPLQAVQPDYEALVNVRGSTAPIVRMNREQRIASNMAQMPARIALWKKVFIIVANSGKAGAQEQGKARHALLGMGVLNVSQYQLIYS